MVVISQGLPDLAKPTWASSRRALISDDVVAVVVLAAAGVETFRRASLLMDVKSSNSRAVSRSAGTAARACRA